MITCQQFAVIILVSQEYRRPATARVLIGPEIGTTDPALVERVLQTSGGRIQEYLEAVTSEGEWSLIFFDKRFSHAVLKRPKTGQFRVRHEHGGIIDVALPPPAYTDFGQNLVELR